MQTGPTDEELRAFVGSRVARCDDLMALTARQIRREAQLHWRVDLNARAASIGLWAVEAAEAVSARAGAPAGAGSGGVARLARDVVEPTDLNDATAHDQRTASALASGVLALASYVCALSLTVHGLADGEHEQAAEALHRAGRLARDARARLADAHADGRYDGWFARVESEVVALARALRDALARAALASTAQQSGREPKLRRAKAATARTRAIAVLTRQLLVGLERERGAGADGPRAALAAEPGTVDDLFARMRSEYAPVITRLFPISDEGVEAHVKALIARELSCETQPSR
jgi:hypothetical protein